LPELYCSRGVKYSMRQIAFAKLKTVAEGTSIARLELFGR
jgi:hypothetical protein